MERVRRAVPMTSYAEALVVRRRPDRYTAASSARRATDPNLHLLEGTALFGPDDVEDLHDGLHPNAAGYRRMGERFFDIAFGPEGTFAPAR